jgi:hypothetical protein
MKKQLTILTIFLFLTQISKAQVEVFKTLEDFEENIFTKYEGEVEYFMDFSFNAKPSSGIEVGSKEKIKIYFTDFWAFKYKNQFFRISSGEFQGLNHSGTIIRRDVLLPVVLVSKGKMCYWENGVPTIDFLSKGDDKKLTCNFTESVYFSSNIDSELYNTNIKLKLFFKREAYRLKILDCFWDVVSKDKKNIKYFKMLSKDELDQKIYAIQSYGRFSDIFKNCIETNNQ